jgi:hypothetical protein
MYNINHKTGMGLTILLNIGRSYWDELEEFRNHSEFSKTVNILPDIVKNSKAAATEGCKW